MDRWIKIGDEPVDEVTLMLVCIKTRDGKEIIRTRQFKDDDWYDEFGNSTMNMQSIEEDVTHFMRLKLPCIPPSDHEYAETTG